MKIIQLLTTMSYGDAVSNDVLALYETMRRNGYETAIYAENIDSRLRSGLVKHIKKMPKLNKDDTIIYHLSTGTELNFKLPKYNGRKILIYHNITPCDFFADYNAAAWKLCAKGQDGLRFLADKVDYCIADSQYNKEDMIKAGYKCKIEVLPILIPFSDYEKKPSEKILRRYKDDDYVNILFTGRIAPNKKQEDVIRAFYMYQKYYNAKARLFIVGSYNGMESYYYKLKNYVNELKLDNVYFTGHIKFDEILSYYSIADLFLCMSEHEGFCVPLIEAMKFDVPIVAYNSSAIGGTLGGAGVLLEGKDPLEVAGMIHYIMSRPKLQDSIKEEQQKRLEDFAHDKIEQQFLQYLSDFLEK